MNILEEEAYRRQSEQEQAEARTPHRGGDHLAENKITIQVSEDTKKLYDTVVANSGSCDGEIEVHLRRALATMLEDKIQAMQVLQIRLKNELDDDAA